MKRDELVKNLTDIIIADANNFVPYKLFKWHTKINIYIKNRYNIVEKYKTPFIFSVKYIPTSHKGENIENFIDIGNKFANEIAHATYNDLFFGNIEKLEGVTDYSIIEQFKNYQNPFIFGLEHGYI